MPTLKQLETALVNADRAGDEDAARALAAEIKRMRAQGAKPAAQAKAKEPSMLEAFQTGLDQAKLNTFRALMSGARAIGLAGPETPREQQQRQNFQRDFGNRMAQVQQARPYSSGAGQLAGEILLTAPLAEVGGAAIARGGAKIGGRAGAVAQRVGRAVQTGGIGAGRTPAQTAALSRGARVGQLAERVVGGAIAGGASAALTGQDVREGAAFGAGLPVVGSVLKRVAGFAGDITKLPRQKAAEIIRKSLANKVDEARAAFAELSPDDKRLAEQVLVDAGVEPDAFFGIGKAIQEQTPTGATPMREALEAQAAARQGRLAEVAGGTTATERRAGTEFGRKMVSEATGPAREAALARANEAGRVVPAAEQLASAARARADEMTASGFVPRMRGLEERAAEQAAVMADNPAYFPDMERIQQTRGVAGAAGQRADDVIAAQIGLRDVGRDMESLVADMAAEGMTPLKVGPIVSQIRSMANQPGTRASTLQRRALTKAAGQLEALADANGVIDARDLYQFRKSELGDIVNVLLAARNQPPSGVKEGAASLMGSIRDMIDNAVEGAGGTGWKDYLTRTRQGFEAVNRQELAAKGAQLAQESPNEFVALMRGERPKIVEDIMGPGTKQYDIAGMALADPRRYLPMLQSAKELETLNRMAELRSAGTGPAGQIMVTATPTRMSRGLSTLAGIPYTPLGFAARGGEQVERAFMAPRVERELANAFLSGQAMGDLVNTYPMKSRISEGVSNLSPMARNIMAQLLRGYAVTPSENNYPE